MDFQPSTKYWGFSTQAVTVIVCSIFITGLDYLITFPSFPCSDCSNQSYVGQFYRKLGKTHWLAGQIIAGIQFRLAKSIQHGLSSMFNTDFILYSLTTLSCKVLCNISSLVSLVYTRKLVCHLSPANIYLLVFFHACKGPLKRLDGVAPLVTHPLHDNSAAL